MTYLIRHMRLGKDKNLFFHIVSLFLILLTVDFQNSFLLGFSPISIPIYLLKRYLHQATIPKKMKTSLFHLLQGHYLKILLLWKLIKRLISIIYHIKI